MWDKRLRDEVKKALTIIRFKGKSCVERLFSCKYNETYGDDARLRF